MNIFISWSGSPSREVAITLRGFISAVLQRAQVYVRSDEIESGAQWYSETTDAMMRSSDFGLVCLTRKNINNPWFAFEMGVLSGFLKPTRLVPVLIDFSLPELSGPLANFQAVTLDKFDVKKLLSNFNMTSEEPLPDSVFEQLFESLWPSFDQDVRINLNRSKQMLEETKSIQEINERLEQLEKHVTQLLK